MKKDKCIIFGCGAIGKKAFYKLKQVYDVIAYADNNSNIWGQELNGVNIVSPNELKSICDEYRTEVIIAVMEYQPIFKQLKEIGLKSIIVWKYGLLYKCNDLFDLYPVEFHNQSYLKKENDVLNVLFVQTTPCIRTNKIAKALKDKGILVSLAYTEASPQVNSQNYAGVYQYYYPICTVNGLIDFVNRSEIDIVHSSNEPDFLSILLEYSDKPIIHDCHDLSSAYKSMTPDEMAVEYIANVKSRGVIYTTEGIRDVACKKFGIEKEKTFVLENLISEELQPTKKLAKISETDGKIHCVYEGGIIGTDKKSHRYFEDLWERITNCGIHIHFYSPSDEKYCHYLDSKSEYLHFEGNISSKELATEMSKYDVGLCILNMNDKNRQYLEYASPNKIQEYVNAGVPVAVGDIRSQVDYVENNQFGKKLDLEADIEQQLKLISSICIPDKILQAKGLTLESKIRKLISFYEMCIG